MCSPPGSFPKPHHSLVVLDYRQPWKEKHKISNSSHFFLLSLLLLISTFFKKTYGIKYHKNVLKMVCKCLIFSAFCHFLTQVIISKKKKKEFEQYLICVCVFACVCMYTCVCASVCVCVFVQHACAFYSSSASVHV